MGTFEMNKACSLCTYLSNGFVWVVFVDLYTCCCVLCCLPFFIHFINISLQIYRAYKFLWMLPWFLLLVRGRTQCIGRSAPSIFRLTVPVISLSLLLLFYLFPLFLFLSDPSPIIGYACHSLPPQLTDSC